MDDIRKALLESERLIATGRQLLKQSKKMVAGDAAPKSSFNRFC